MQALGIATVEDLVRVLDEHPQWLEALRSRLLTRELLELPQRLEDFAAATDRRFAEIDGRFAEIDGRFAEIDGRFAEIDGRLTEIDGRLTEIDGRLTEIDGRFAEIDGRFAEIDGRLTEIDGRLTEHDRRFDEIDGRLTEIDGRLTEHDRRFDEIDGRLTEIDGRLTEIDGRLTEHDRRFDSLERQIGQLRTDIAPLKAAHARTAAMDEADLMAEELGLTLTGILDREELRALVQRADTGGIPKRELRSFRAADMVLRAVDAAGAECYVAVEVSYTANGRDTDRACRNARFLTRFTGQRAAAVVAGLRIDERIRPAVESGDVAWFQLSPEVLEVD